MPNALLVATLVILTTTLFLHALNELSTVCKKWNQRNEAERQFNAAKENAGEDLPAEVGEKALEIEDVTTAEEYSRPRARQHLPSFDNGTFPIKKLSDFFLKVTSTFIRPPHIHGNSSHRQETGYRLFH